jgi:uncharacterized membrane protein YbhN (UPF0104 family)
MMGMAALIAAAAIAFVWHQFRRYSLDDVAASMAAVPPAHLIGTAFFAAMSYLTLTFFDTLGIRYAGYAQVPYRRIALASFCSLSIGHNVGFAALSTGALRLRFYTRMGLKVGDVARVILFCATTVGLGIIALACAVLLLATPPEGAGITPEKARLVGFACLAVLAAYLGLALVAKAPLRLGAWSLPVPPPRFALLQIVIGFANFAFVAAALWQAISAPTGAGYLEVVVAYVMGVVAGLISHVPGGLGVLEAVVILVLPDAGALGGLVLFRLVYYLVPLVLGLAGLGLAELFEVRSRRRGGSFIGGGGSRAGGTGIGFGGSSIGTGASGSGGGTGGVVGG